MPFADPETIDRVTAADAAFFERHPQRTHRVRLAALAEIAQFAKLAGQSDPRPPSGFAHYVVVRNVAPGARMRLPFTAPAGNDTDLSEAEAAWLYRTHGGRPSAQVIEASLRKILKKRQH